jgi:hypothetical protein
VPEPDQVDPDDLVSEPGTTTERKQTPSARRTLAGYHGVVREREGRSMDICIDAEPPRQAGGPGSRGLLACRPYDDT